MYSGERFNSISHLVGAALALIGATLLITLAALSGDPWRIVAFSIYGATLVTLFLASTLYHSLRGKAKAVFQKLDHCSIYLFIAGSYTPFALLALPGSTGWLVLAASWSLATLGVALELSPLARGSRILSLAIYLGMGWLALVVIGPLWQALGWAGLSWLLGGGVLYTLGVLFYVAKERIRHSHGIWHLFVLGGSACHFVALLLYLNG
ncbi:MAG: hemolysin III family protein [Betaproteobacteria bacterium]|jgi:hemolysin III|uniref:Predicted membrane protein, hemolysin III homolog n=1 Tax=Serpentinimonas maccroryi TaxID=1458426 RepID=A0A060NLP7_9BURK|nr:hemolysin III family protein [Serpentinimonas maccroryi]MBA4252513.1 hemolysin III [Comamonadaceae bacterium]MCL5968764.1 hemolysin III family protein [Betaproteobacteria bacterium]OYX59519.1 MAG: hemolysin III [Comamonadaceae bacterium 32-67-11]BAO82305.1 predicted membrane protein, hemolysin III homolog [Serpentinimonas maccroryi]